MEITIPIRPISVNEAWQGRRFKTKKCNDYCKQFIKIAPVCKKISGIIEIEYRFYLINHKKTDYDNLIKVTQDLLKECGYIEDDRKIYKATIYKIPSKIDSVSIKIKKLDNIGKQV